MAKVKTLKELLQEREAIDQARSDLDKQIKDTQAEELKEQIKVIKDIMKTYSITAKHLGFIEPVKSPKIDGNPTSSEGKIDGRTIPVKPKYINPNNPSETWTGRGKRPKWVIELEKAGGDVETCRIK